MQAPGTWLANMSSLSAILARSQPQQAAVCKRDIELQRTVPVAISKETSDGYDSTDNTSSDGSDSSTDSNSSADNVSLDVVPEAQEEEVRL